MQVTEADLIGRANACGDEVFRSKYVSIPGYLKQWTEVAGGLKGKRVLDFGCGNGTTACAVAATCEALSVEGVDINREHESCAQVMRKCVQSDLPSNLSFRTLTPGEPLPERRYDVVYSWSVFEHIDRDILDGIVTNIRESLVDNGVLFVQVAPLYFSAEGSHLARYGIRSWEHLSMQLNRLRDRVLGSTGFSDSEKRNDWGCFETLNKITATELVEAICRNGFKVLRRYQTQNSAEPRPELVSIYDRDVLRAEQIVVLFGKDEAEPATNAVLR